MMRFIKDDAGRWLLEETGGMEGLGVQQYRVEPVEGPGDLRRWVYAADPEFLTIDMSACMHDRGPLIIGVWPGHTRVFMEPSDRHLVTELDLTGIMAARDRRSAGV